MKPTYRETVLLGKKLGCRVSIKSTSSHTTLTRTCCLLSSLDLSAEQWQLSTIRSGQFLLLRLDSHSPTITHSKLSALMVDWYYCFLFLSSFFKLYPPSFCDKSGPFHIAFRYVQVQPVIELQSRSHTLLVTCCGLCSCKLAALLWRLNLSGMWNIKAEERCTFAILSCNVSSKVFSVLRHVRGKLPPARFQSPDKLYCDISSPSGSRDEIRGWGK